MSDDSGLLPRHHISEIVELADSHENWEIDDWEFESGRYSGSALTLTLSWSACEERSVIKEGTKQAERVKNLLDIVAKLEGDFDKGVPVDVVVEAAEEVGITTEEAAQEVETLKQKGEIYQPHAGRVRTT